MTSARAPKNRAAATYATAAAPAAARSRRDVIVAALMALFVVITALASAARKDVTQGFDELAHASYVAHLQETGRAWPALTEMRMLDASTFLPTSRANYLNHPSPFYELMAVIGPSLTGHPSSLFMHRAIDALLVGLGVFVLLWLGLGARAAGNAFYAYAVPIVCVPVLIPLAGSVNNDNLAFLGGALAMLGCWQAAAGERRWLALALAGLVIAGWAKLTGLLLAGAFVGATVGYLAWRGKISWRWIAAGACAFALAAAPYAIFFLQYGSLTPQTPAQVALIADGARTAGWADLPRKSFSEYALFFTSQFIANWMPALVARDALQFAMLAVPVATLACAAAGIALAFRRLGRGEETARDVVVLAGAFAIAATFAVHMAYSYQRHLATGWLLDAYPRYYLPLIAIVPLACLMLLAAIRAPRWRAALMGFLIVGPIAFRLLGAPL